jgi:hypothetical protein
MGQTTRSPHAHQQQGLKHARSLGLDPSRRNHPEGPGAPEQLQELLVSEESEPGLHDRVAQEEQQGTPQHQTPEQSTAPHIRYEGCRDGRP